MPYQIDKIDFDRFFHTCNSLLCVAESQGCLLDVSTYFVEFLGYSKDDLCGRPLLDFVHPSDLERTKKELKLLSEGNPSIRFINQYMRGDGRVAHLLWNAELDTENGLIYAGATDITHLVLEETSTKLELQWARDLREEPNAAHEEINRLKMFNHKINLEKVQLEEAVLKEKELNELKTRFMAIASHQFRTPLTAISSCASLIQRYTKEDDQEKRVLQVDRIKTSIRKMVDLLEDFLSIDRLESGATELRNEEIDLSFMAGSLVKEVNGMLKKGMTINTMIDGKKRNIRSDRSILNNVMLNLLSNAVKYSGEDSEIELTIADTDTGVELSVKDHGIGIPALEQKQLFNRFFRASNARSIQGTGLGLGIVKQYVDLMHGEIRYESEENVGSTFTVTLPDGLPQN